MITAYYYSNNSGCLLSACCVPGVLLMVLLFILIEDLLYMPAQGSSSTGDTSVSTIGKAFVFMIPASGKERE